ncbi:MAG: hypothetical protein KAS39_04090, partial [Actinomycetia bacterium]|nr:hypothetical protein [Actinomycetes bacterium]
MKKFLNWPDLPIRFKIIIPYITLILFTAIIAGYVARTWVSQRIEEELTQRIREEYTQAIKYFENEMVGLERTSRGIAETSEIEKSVFRKEYVLTKKHLIPRKGVYGLDFIS